MNVPHEGLLQVSVSFNPEWRYVCGDNWELAHADVACRQLGYPGASNTTLVDLPHADENNWFNVLDSCIQGDCFLFLLQFFWGVVRYRHLWNCDNWIFETFEKDLSLNILHINLDHAVKSVFTDHIYHTKLCYFLLFIVTS